MFYNGDNLLNQTDINGNKPEIYCSFGNRTAGKTFFFINRWIKNFLKNGEKWLYLFRYREEMPNCSETIFNDVVKQKKYSVEITEKPMVHGLFYELFINKKSCGYACAINSAYKIKRYSHFLTDVSVIFFDEFQNDRYCPNEIEKFHSIHTSVARGGGKCVRFVPVVMCSNSVSLLNPYFIAWKCSHLININNRFLKLNGGVLEYVRNDYAINQQLSSGFNKMFSQNIENELGLEYYDNSDFVDKLTGKSQYFCNIKYVGKIYGVRYNGFYHVSKNVDSTFNKKIAFSVLDVDYQYTNTQCDLYKNVFRIALKNGKIRFDSLETKSEFYQMLG